MAKTKESTSSTNRFDLLKRIFFWNPDNFSRLNWKFRLPVLILITVLVLLKLKKYYEQYLYPHIVPVISGTLPDMNKIQSLVFFDILVCIGIAVSIAVLLGLAFGRPDRPGRLLWVFRNHPFITFAVFTCLLSFFLRGAPKLLPAVFMNLDFETYPVFDFSDIHPMYLYAAGISAVCIGLSIADIAFKPGVSRVWAYLFLLLPQFPLLWWNALSWMFPSRYWAFWRPVLAVASCLTPLLVFPVTQPIRSDIRDEGCKPVVTRPAKQQLPCIEGYYMKHVPSEGELYLRCDVHSRLTRFNRDANGHWEKTKEHESGYYWSKAAFDLANKRAFFVNFWDMNIEIIQIPDLEITDRIPLFPAAIPIQGYQYHLAYDNRGTLAIANDKVFLSIIDVNRKTVLTSRRIFTGSETTLQELQFNSTGTRLYVMDNRRLLVFDPKTLDITQMIDFSSDIFNLYQDEKRNRLIISCPEPGKLIVLNDRTLRPEMFINVPIGVRNLALDSQRELLFVSSLSGAIEVRNANDFKRVSRTRLSPWIHGLEPVPQFGELIVSVAINDPLVWQYDPPNTLFSPFDIALQLVEKIYVKYVVRNPPEVRDQSDSPQKNMLIQTDPEKYLIFSDNDFYLRSTPDSFNKIMEFDLTVVKNEEEFNDILEEGSCFDRVYINIIDHLNIPNYNKLIHQYHSRYNATQAHCRN